MIREELAHAKVANPTTLLTRFAEELRRAPAAGDFEGASAGEEIRGERFRNSEFGI